MDSNLGGIYGVITIRPLGGQPAFGLSVARGLAAKRKMMCVWQGVAIDSLKFC
jgi:hypothetical protein